MIFDGPPPQLTRAPGPVASPAPAPATLPAEAPPRPAIHTVTQLTRQIRTVLERQVGAVWVEGELSNVRGQPSGHTYFTLKDEGAQLACVLFRQNARKRFPQLEDGLKVRVYGELTVYEPRGQYQLVVEDIQATGQGLLQAQFEALKRRLAAEGLFASERKRPLPRFPQCVGLVTSPSGAAVRDMLRILQARAPWVKVLIYPVKVQGDGAAEEIAAAVQWLGQWATQADASADRPDVLIVGRGGGSIEDLWSFNEEVVARAIANCPLPVISAVGHEIDFTIADFAADVRAPTPTAAAQLAVPDGAQLHERLSELASLLAARARTGIAHARALTELLARRGLAREPLRRLAQYRQEVDEAAEALQQAVRRRLDEAYRQWQSLNQQLEALRPAARLAQQRQQTSHLTTRLQAIVQHRLATAHERLKRLEDLLRTLGPQNVLERGYSCTLGPDGRPVRRASDVRPGDRLRTRLAAGEIVSRVEE